MSKHTSGDWINQREKGHYFGPYESVVSEENRQIAIVYGETEEEAIANGRLIAAAPKLLNGLKELMYWYRSVSNGECTKNYQIEDDIEAIIKQATPIT